MKKYFIIFVLLLSIIGISYSQDMPFYPFPFEVEHLRGDIYLIKENIDEAPGSGYLPTKFTNNVVLSNRHGSLIVDSDDPAVSIDAFFDAIREIPYIGNVKFDYLISTHWHLDHTGLNHYFAEKRAIIIGH